jgi:hypothetical protein
MTTNTTPKKQLGNSQRRFFFVRARHFDWRGLFPVFVARSLLIRKKVRLKFRRFPFLDANLYATMRLYRYITNTRTP